jgi:2-hydroxychromene-2-carboxylate isomerase
MNNEIEFWYEFGSNYSYLSAMRIESLAQGNGLAVRWRPFLLGPIFKSLGWETSPFVLQERKGAYMWEDMVRQCRKYGVPWRRPSEFPRRALLPMRLAILGTNEPWIGAFTRRVMLMNFAEDRNIDSPDSMREVLNELGLDAEKLIVAAQAEVTKARLRAQTEAAEGRGIFGAPTFFVGGQMYWGNDRLEDAIGAALVAHEDSIR